MLQRMGCSRRSKTKTMGEDPRNGVRRCDVNKLQGLVVWSTNDSGEEKAVRAVHKLMLNP